MQGKIATVQERSVKNSCFTWNIWKEECGEKCET